MNNEVKVSVIVPIYNVEKYLPRCIESLINQTLKNIEIILINDGSPDNSLEICEKYRVIDNRIKIIDKPNGGLSDARNVGIDNAVGEYILFIDSDDWCESNMIEELYIAISNNQVDISTCGYDIDYSLSGYSIEVAIENNICIGKEEISKCIYNLDQSGMFNVVWNKLYKLEIIKSNQLKFEKDGMPGEDLIFNCEYFKYINGISTINNRLYHYIREEQTTLVSKYRRNLYEQVLRFNKCRKLLYEFYNMDNIEFKKCYANTYVGYIFTCIPNLYRVNSDLNLNERRDIFNKIMNDKTLSEYLRIIKPKTINEKLFYWLIKTKNSFLADFIYMALFKFRNNFDDIYRHIRKHIINN